jgi:serine/threonine-protein kinase
MAEVWRAEDVALGRPVAIKLWTSPEPGGDAGAAAGVWREARDAARLVHPNVVAVYDVVADAAPPFLVMELVAGRNLAMALAEQGPLSYARVARIGAQAARALAAAHAAGLVHRDVKPGNLLLTPDGTVKLTDFGIAGAAPSDVGDVGAVAGRLVGTGAYVSPEQAVGLPATPASDLYALGCVLYELLVGQPPFIGDDPDLLVRLHVEDQPEPPGQVRPDIPAELEQAVLRLLAKNPADRPEGADRVAVVLESVGDTLIDPYRASAEPRNATQVLPTLTGATRTGPALGREPYDPSAAAPRPSPPPLSTWLGERPLLAAAAAAVVLISVVIAAVALFEANGAGPGTPVAGVPSQVIETPTPSKTVSRRPGQAQRPQNTAALLSALDRRLAQQAAAGRLDPKTGKELRRKTEEIGKKLADGKAEDVAGKVEDIRKKLDDAARKGEWTPDPTTTRLIDRLAAGL